jgi:pyruvate/2-oxoglutarate dehydrogenase complex dihydrolipoamide acyltransferase (E2) component
MAIKGLQTAFFYDKLLTLWYLERNLMAHEVVLPKLGQTMKEGTLTRIWVAAGDQVRRGDVLFEIETDKATLEMEADAEGFVKAVLVEPGQTVPVQTPLLILGDQAEQLDSAYLARIADHVRAAVALDSPTGPSAGTSLKSTGLAYAQMLCPDAAGRRGPCPLRRDGVDQTRIGGLHSSEPDAEDCG